MTSSLMSHAMTRRAFGLGTLGTAAGLALFRTVPITLAHQADLASLGYPTLDVTITATSFDGLPESTAAGRYLLNATVDAGVEFGSIDFLLPYGMSAEEFLAFMTGGGGEEGSPAPEASPAPEEGGELLPAFIYQSHFASGTGGPAGATVSAVIDLLPGDWIVLADDPSAPQQPGVLSVTGEYPANVVDPEATVSVLLVDFAITVDGTLTAGDHVIKIENQGAQPHFLSIFSLPAGTTNDDIGALLMSEMTGDAPPEGLNPETDIVDVFFAPTQSIDTRSWHTVTLAAGTYGAACFFPTAGVGDPHAFHGMHTVFVVA